LAPDRWAQAPSSASGDGPGCRVGRSQPTPCGFSFTRSPTISATSCALATPEPIKDWSLTSLKEKLIRIGAKVVSHGRYVALQMAEVAISRHLFADILRPIDGLRHPPDPSPA
jgi:hypothetical protein